MPNVLPFVAGSSTKLFVWAATLPFEVGQKKKNKTATILARYLVASGYHLFRSCRLNRSNQLDRCRRLVLQTVAFSIPSNNFIRTTQASSPHATIFRTEKLDRSYASKQNDKQKTWFDMSREKRREK